MIVHSTASALSDTSCLILLKKLIFKAHFRCCLQFEAYRGFLPGELGHSVYFPLSSLYPQPLTSP